jgi:23S rRNA (adenine2030-N6)-methyltransferase
MLSYRHAYHAGNFADVMKHAVLLPLLGYLTQKAAPLCYIDTHAGAGSYDLRSEHAEKTREYRYGIEVLWSDRSLPDPLQSFVDVVRTFNRGGALRYYPGSAVIAQQLLRRQDRLELCEMHTSDFALLESAFRGDRRVHCHQGDGFRIGLGKLPPIEKRGLVFMDPSYELKEDHRRVFDTVEAMCRRFATGVYALWYPVIDNRAVEALRHNFLESRLRNVLNLELVIEPDARRPGMRGCGMVIVNPPWTLAEVAEPMLSVLAERLGRNGYGSFSIDQWVAE